MVVTMSGGDRDAGDGKEEGGDLGDAPTPLTDRVPPWLAFRWGAAAAAGALVVLLLAYGLYTVRGILELVLIALFVALCLQPAVQWLVNHRIRRPLAITLVLLALVALFAAFVWSIVPPVTHQGGKLIGGFPGYLSRLSAESRPVRAVTDRYHLTDRVNTVVAQIPGRLAGGALGFARRLGSLIAATLTVLVLSIYFMADLPRLERGVVRLFPRARRPRVTQIVGVVVNQVGGYMVGNILISIIAGVAAFACLELVRVPYALPLAVIVAITDLIPMIGATLGAVVCLVVSVFTVGIWPRSVIVLLFFIAYQQTENYLIAPRVMHSTVDLAAAEALLAALIGTTLLGLVGAIMAIPIAATIKVITSQSVASEEDAGSPPPDG